MANQPQGGEQVPMPQPLEREPDALVENIFPIPDTEAVPDEGSTDRMGLYLMKRFEPDSRPETRVVLEATGRTLPGLRRVPTGHQEVTRLRKAEGWLFGLSPRVALIATLGSAALFNAAGNWDTVEGGAEWIGHGVYRMFDPVHDTTETIPHTTTIPGRIVDIQVNAAVASTDVSGRLVTLNSTEIQSLGQRVDELKAQGGSVLEVSVVGRTSDDWGAKGDAAFGQADPENARLGGQIARQAYEKIAPELAAAGLAGAPTSFKQHEAVLPAPVAQKLVAQAKAAGYGSLAAAVKAADRGELREGELFEQIRDNIIASRGETVDVKVQLPGASTTETTYEQRVIPGVDDAPDVPAPRFIPFIPVPFIRRRERYTTMKATHQWQVAPSIEIMTPRIIKEDADQAWLRVRKEAVNEDGTLVKNAWAYSRKYEHLLRDGRIAEVLRADFKSAEDAGQEEKSLRIMFVDEAPSQETVDTFSGLLTAFAAMDNGKISDRVSAIFVYPSENAGTEHDAPKRIAMGIDKQSEAEVLGTYTYILDLVELHMPTKLEAADLEAVLQSFSGPAWTMAHEVAGHGTDDNDTPLRLRRVTARGIPNAHVVDGDPRANKMNRLQKLLSKLPSRPQDKKAPVAFDITYQVVDKNGRTVTTPPVRVKEGDPRLAHATQATVVGYQPTQYSSTNAPEHYAETAAAVTTGISIPYEEAAVTVPGLTADDGQQAVFADGYRPDARGQRLFTQSVGAEDGGFPVSFENPPSVTISRLSPEDDPLIRQEMIRARQLAVLTPNEMVAILARSTRRRGDRA